MTDLQLENAKLQLQKVIDLLKNDLLNVRTGRATPSLIENLEVSAYETRMKLIELATITSPEPHLLLVTPFDADNMTEITKAILSANLGLSPVIDGTLIRITVPGLTEERRLELVKLMHQKLESARVMIRQVRRESMDEIKKNAQNEDEEKRLDENLQDLIDEMIGEIDLIGQQKEQELMTI